VTLFINTSTNQTHIALVSRLVVLNEKVRLTKNDASKYLVQDIKELVCDIEGCDYKIQDIKKIVIGIGPGSYTGVRLGVTVGKMLAYFLGAKLFTVSSLFYLSSGYDKVASYVDARNDCVFGGIYEDGKIVLKDGYYSREEFFSHKTSHTELDLNQDECKIDYKKILRKAKQKKDYVYLEPNYLRATEAQRNLEKGALNDSKR
jgi:tRNA threonylcarbamoyl adenosine modification protein YeaZ